MTDQYCIISTTFADIAEGQTIMDGLINQGLAACIQAIDINSVYKWKGKVNSEKETLLLIKTKTSLYKKVEEFIKKHHSYEVPEIIQIPITTGLPAYLSWISSECSFKG